MAIDESPGPRCWSTRHQLTPPPLAAAFVRETNSFLNAWSPRCRPCVDQLAELVDTHVLVVYIDPTRQRRPQPDPDHWTEYHIDEHGRVVPDANLVPRPDLAP